MRNHRAVLGPALALAALAIAVPRAEAQSLPTSEACVACHLTLEDDRLAEPARVFETDLHFELGFGCLDCHGDQGDGMLERSAGFLSAPDRRSIPGMCGRCHSDGAFMRQFNPSERIDQEAEYWTSRHGQALAEHNDPNVATCVDCHDVHQMLRPSDSESTVYPTNVPATCGACHSDPEVMGGYGLPTDQAEKYRTSVHGTLLYEEGDVSAPVCNDCHGNHGAAPPGIGSVRNVCGQCHAVMADFFAESGHVELFEESDLPGCAACHEHHEIRRVDETDLDARTAELCLGCHQSTDPAGRAFQRMRIVLDSLNEAAEASRNLLEDAHSRGMEVSNALFELEDVGNAYTRGKNAIHTFSVEPVRKEAAAGFAVAEAAHRRGLEALDEWQFRRVGLVVSTGIIVLLIVALLMRIKELDARMEVAPTAGTATAAPHLPEGRSEDR